MENYLVIGGSSGIGKELVSLLSSKGSSVDATYLSTEPPVYDGVKYHKFDVHNDEFDTDMLPEKLDGLAYCPGAINLKPFARLKPEDFIADFQFQVVGAIKIIQKVLTKLKMAEGASVVLFSTVAVQQGFNFHSQVATSKGAIEGLVKALAAEFAPAIRFNAIAPSLTNTPLASKLLSSEEKIQANAMRHPMKRIGESKDIANMAAFLLSKDTSWMTGQVIHIDGGMSTVKN